MTTFQPRQWSLAPRLGEDQEEKEEDSPSFGRCRPLSRVADSGPKAKVNHPLISPLPSLRLYPRMCGLDPEPDLRPDLSPVNPSSTPGALMSQGRPNKGPADGYLLPEPQEQPHQLGLAEVLPGRVRNLPGPRTSKPQKRPHSGSADGPRQPMLQQRSLPKPREQPHQLGLAEVLPGRGRNLPGLRSSSESQPSAWG